MTAVRWRLADLALGMRLAWRGARARTLLTATGIALASAVLLFAAALPHAADRQAERNLAREWSMSTGPGAALPPAPSPHTVVVQAQWTQWFTRSLSGVAIRADGDDPVLPPGVSRLPQPGEIIASPALARLLREPDAALLRERLGGRVVGEIAPAGLAGPSELRWYSALGPVKERLIRDGRVQRVSQFGGEDSSAVDRTFLRLVVLVGGVVLLFPIAILVFTASRFGGERRDRRLAALRLVGAGRERVLWIAAGESLAGAALGLLGGAVLFVLARQVIEGVSVLGISLFRADLQPSPALVGAVVAGVVAVSILATFGSLRRVAIEPLSVSRRGSARGARRLWWRLIPGALGALILLPMVRRGGVQTDEFVRVAVGAILMLGSVTALLPWAIERTVQFLVPWSPASRLAIRALQQDPSGAARVAGGVAAAVAGAIALQMLLTITEHRGGADPWARANGNVVWVDPVDMSDAREARRVRAITAGVPGVTRVAATASYDLRGHAGLAPNGALPELTVGTCADLAAIAEIGACDEATSLYRLPRGAGGVAGVPGPAVPRAGERVKVPNTDGTRGSTKFTLPADLVDVAARPEAQVNPGVLATFGVASRLGIAAPNYRRTVAFLDPSDRMAAERLRTAVAAKAPLITAYQPGNEIDELANVRRALLAGAGLLLVLLCASLLVTTVEQLGERRRSLATLAATGVPARVLRRSLLLRAAVPTVLALGLAVVTGVSLGAALLALQHEPIAVDLGGGATVLGLAVALIVGATSLALPVLARVAAPASMRTE